MMAGGFTFQAPSAEDMLQRATAQNNARLVQGLLSAQEQARPQVAQEPVRGGTETANKAFSAGATRAQEAHAEAKAQEALQQQAQVLQAMQEPVQGLMGSVSPALSPYAQREASYQYGKQLNDYKLGYADAEARGDAQGMQRYSEMASALRDMAQQSGLDMGAYGGDKTQAQVQAALDASRIANYNDLFAGRKTPEQYYRDRVREYYDSGTSYATAQKAASRDALQYAADYMADAKLAFYNYGLTPEGAINAHGSHILSDMRYTDPESIALENAYFAKPVNDYTWTRGEQSRDLGLERAMTTMGEETLHKGLLMDKDAQAKLAMVEAQGAQQRANIAAQGAQARASQDNAAGHDMAKTRYLAGLGAMQGSGGRSSNGGSSSSSMGEEKLSKSDMELVNAYDNAYATARQALSSDTPNREYEAQALDALNEILFDMREKGKINMEQYSELYAQANQLQQWFQTRHGYAPTQNYQ